MSKNSEYFREILERVRLALQLDNSLSSDQPEKILRAIEELVKASLERIESDLKRVIGERDAARSQVIQFRRLASVALVILGLLMVILLISLLLYSQGFCSLPTIIIYAPDPNTSVLPGKSIAIFSRSKPKDAPVNWNVTCSEGKNCGALAKTTGEDNFFTAPNAPGEMVTVSATVTDRCGRKDGASLLLKVGNSR
jgi:hypothetical protein